jgi:hypothetical protein
MHFLKVTGMIVAMLVASLSAHATKRYVSQSAATPYLTIASAMSAAIAGDTILIGAGTYPEGINCTQRLTIIGAGWDATQVNSISISSGLGVVIEGIWFPGIGSYPCLVNAGVDSLTVRRCRLSDPITAGYPSVYQAGASALITFEDCQIIQAHPSVGLVGVNPGHLVFRNCVFVHQSATTTSYAFNGPNGNLEIYNCVFLGLNRIFNCTGILPIVFVNNIVYDWLGSAPSYGTYLTGSMLAYNASDRITPPGTNALLLTANPFVSYDSTANLTDLSNLRLAAGSVCIDAGNPGLVDLDATRSDLGVYGGPRPLVERGVPSYPFPISMAISPVLISVGDTIQVNTSGRVGPRY